MDRRPTGATHSFRLSIRACEIMDNHPAIKPNSKYHNKSRWASTAIQWFFDSPTLLKERDSDTGDFTGKFVVGNAGQPRPIDLFLKIEALEKELDQVSGSGQVADQETKDVPQSRGIRRIFHFIRSFWL